MAKPIGGASGPAATTSMAADDTFIIWRDANNDVRVITKDDLFGGTVSLLGTAQTYSALKTYSAGISFGNETLSAYDEGTWTPTVTGSVSNPTVTYTNQDGKYTRIGNMVFFAFRVTLSTYSGGSGTLLFSLPITAGAQSTEAVVRLVGVDVPTGTVNVTFNVAASTTTGWAIANIDNASSTDLTTSDYAAGDTIRVTGHYFV